MGISCEQLLLDFERNRVRFRAVLLFLLRCARGDSGWEGLNSFARHREKRVFAVMKVFLQQITTGFYVGANEPLVLDDEQARVFGGSLEAIDYCVAQGIDDVEVLLKFSDSRYDVRS